MQLLLVRLRPLIIGRAHHQGFGVFPAGFFVSTEVPR